MSDETLTLYATGPAEREKTNDTEHAEVVETTTVTLEATIEDVDATSLDDIGHVGKNGAVLKTNDIAERIVDRLSDDDVNYRAGHEVHDDWDVMLRGRVDDWEVVALEAANSERTLGSEAAIAQTACEIIDDLREFGTDRPTLAMLDLVTQFDVDYERAGLLEDLNDSDEVDETTEEVTA